MEIYAGTSGFSYKEWKGPFYPENLPAKGMLAYYSQHLPAVEGDVLFSAGKSTLRDGARQSLDSVARVLTSSYAGRTIKVAGHTDTDPIRKSGFKSNHHLAFERAYSVREYLIKRGVPEGNIFIASHGPNRARGSKKESRRVEIAVVLNN